jgi:AraC-like DNA-binding protein
VACIAGRAGLSQYHFIRIFAAHFGETPHQFRRRHRLELAKRMLAEGDDTVTEICMAVGFSSLGSFSSLFRSRFGESPRAFRRRIRVSAACAEAPAAELTPGCLTLLNRAWQAESQFSRSDDGRGAGQSPGTPMPENTS